SSSRRQQRYLPAFPTRRSSDLVHGSDRQILTAPTGGFLYATQTRPGLVDTAATADASSRLAYNVYDLTVGRTVPLENFFSLRWRSEEHTSELQSRVDLVCRLLL